MKLVVQEDFDSVREILDECLDGYVRRYETVVSRATSAMERIMMTLPLTINESNPLNMKTVETMVKSPAAFLVASFEKLSYLHSHLINRVTETMPMRLVSDQLSLNKCEHLQTNITGLLLTTLLMQVPFDKILLSNVDISELYTQFKMYISNKCVSELPSESELLDNNMNEMNLKLLQFIGVELGFNNAEYLKTETRYLQNIQAIATDLSDKLSAYAENRTTLIQLSTELTQSMFSDIQHNLDSIIYAVERDNIRPLFSKSNSMLRNVKQWYGRSLGVFPNLVPIYDNINIEDRLRALKIWRRPVARFKTGDILHFLYPATESWRSWELTATVGDFVFSGTASTKTSTTVEEYIQILQSELTKMLLECKLVREEVIVAINDVIEDFNIVHTESLMESNFVM